MGQHERRLYWTPRSRDNGSAPLPFTSLTKITTAARYIRRQLKANSGPEVREKSCAPLAAPARRTARSAAVVHRITPGVGHTGRPLVSGQRIAANTSSRLPWPDRRSTVASMRVRAGGGEVASAGFWCDGA